MQVQSKAIGETVGHNQLVPLASARRDVEVSAIIPCLNEERTLANCIRKAQQAFAERGLVGEVVVGDNGSSDASVQIALELGARVVHQPVKGYGAAIQAAAQAAHGRYLIMADADESYDWSVLGTFVDALEHGADLVMGNRFAGGIEEGAMPPLHKYLGNPVLSAVARTLHRSPVRDFHCGMRGFTRDAFIRMGARSPGMEFASEMVINAHRAGLCVREVPIRLYPDKRGRAPHLRSFRDGWRHLSLILANAPDTLYLGPGLTLLALGVLGLAALAAGPIHLAGLYLGIHWVALAAMATLIGLMAVLFGTIAKVAIALYHPFVTGRMVPLLARSRPVEALALTGGLLAAVGFCADAWLAYRWIAVGGAMETSVHFVFVDTTLCVAGVSMVLGAFVLKLLLDSLKLHGWTGEEREATIDR
ncbi:glycosyltransferase family 2 protein [Novosphingobium profundi]|uniref:glycosyltransferase family 2 protein n=1 Tax=Novosphingobium profundi TaxID=1774954 RepID=UPI001BDAB552|nr:glycosyltransferase family 2 protein [Novosphingobium profundi]MBT0668265.1 glycosyltransferase family 2 protein [Novosphingobium profundi]